MSIFDVQSSSTRARCVRVCQPVRWQKRENHVGHSSDAIFARMWKPLGLILVAALVAQSSNGQVPCPVSLTSAVAGAESIELKFRNKGKLPIEQLSLICAPPSNHQSRTTLCQNVSGIFYPGMQYSADIPYAGANRHHVLISVRTVHLAGGVSWNTHSLNPCKSVRAARAK